jgi:hypothetical protein
MWLRRLGTSVLQLPERPPSDQRRRHPLWFETACNTLVTLSPSAASGCGELRYTQSMKYCDQLPSREGVSPDFGKEGLSNLG